MHQIDFNCVGLTSKVNKLHDNDWSKVIVGRGTTVSPPLRMHSGTCGKTLKILKTREKHGTLSHYHRSSSASFDSVRFDSSSSLVDFQGARCT